MEVTKNVQFIKLKNKRIKSKSTDRRFQHPLENNLSLASLSRKRSEICLKLVKIPEWRQRRRSGVFIVTLNMFHIIFLFLLFLLLTLDKSLLAGFVVQPFRKTIHHEQLLNFQTILKINYVHELLERIANMNKNLIHIFRTVTKILFGHIP